MASSPAPSLYSGDTPIEGGHLVANLAVAALVVPPLIWSSGLLPVASNLYRRLFGGRHRHALPLPISHAAADSIRIAGGMPESLAILEDVVQHTLSNLHSIHKSLQYWQSRAEGTDSQLVYFMMFERGPKAFVEATCQVLTSLRSNGSPSQYLLNSASDMFATKFTVLKKMQHCLAVFLSKVYSEVDTCRERLTESSDQSLRTLIAVLDFVFHELETSFRNAGNWQILSTHDGNVPVRLFKPLPEVPVGSSDAATESATISTGDLLLETFKRADKCGVRKHEAQLIAESLERMLLAFSEQTLNEKLPQDASEQALMGTVMKRYEEELKHPVQNMFSGELARTMLIEIQKHRLDFQQSLVELDRIVKANRINFAMLAAVPTFGLSLLLLLPIRALAMHDQGAEGQDRIACRRRRLLLIQAEQKLMEFMRCKANGMLDEYYEAVCGLGKTVFFEDRDTSSTVIDPFTLGSQQVAFSFPVPQIADWLPVPAMPLSTNAILPRQLSMSKIWAPRRLAIGRSICPALNLQDEEASCEFGLALYALDRLYNAVEFHARETGEWSRVREDIFHLAMPSIGMEHKKAVFSRLESMYECLLPPEHL